MAYTTMKQLMDQYRSYAKAQNWEAAHDTLLYGVDCGHLPARLELARLYKECPFLGMPLKERYAKAQYHYRSLQNLMDPELSARAMAVISMEMAELYACMHRPVGHLAMLLRAKRLGADVPERDVQHARRLMRDMDIRDFGQSAQDALDLGIELSLSGSGARLTELLLREASESENPAIRGEAALALADFYLERKNESIVYLHEAHRSYHRAAEAGYPEYFSRRNAV